MAVKKAATQQRLAQCSIEQAPEGVFWVKSAGLVHQANRWLCELLGYSEAELQSLYICDLVTDLSHSQWPDIWRQFREKKIWYHKGSFATPIGDVVAVEINTQNHSNSAANRQHS